MIDQSVTNDSGMFWFRNIQRGTYILLVAAVGFKAQTVHVDLSLTSERGITISLEPDSPVAPAVARASAISAHEMSMPEKARNLVSSGEKKLYQEKDPKAALADFQQAVSIAPAYYEAHYQCAIAQISLGQHEKAEKELRAAVEISGDKYGEAEVGLGTMMLDKGNLEPAEKALRRGIELNPKFWLGHYELGRALLSENHIDDAQKSAEEARSLAPSAPIVYRLLSNIHLRKKDYPALLQDLDAYIQLDPDSPAGLRAKAMRAEVEHQVGSRTIASDSPETP